jgi:battenin
MMISSYFPSSTTMAFWSMGLLNNMPYVVMLAGAKSISEGGTALVFLANIMPGFLLKLSSPYWFDRVSYTNRIRMGSVLMCLSFTFVATFSYLKDNSSDDGRDGFYVLMELIGVAFSSAQGDLGEATLLALSGRADSIIANDQESGGSHESNKERKSLCITAFASGTGLAGPLGFAFIVFFTKVLKFPLTIALFIALVFPVFYLFIFSKYLLQFVTNCSSFQNDQLEEVQILLGESSAHSKEELETQDIGDTESRMGDDEDNDVHDNEFVDNDLSNSSSSGHQSEASLTYFTTEESSRADQHTSSMGTLEISNNADEKTCISTTSQTKNNVIAGMSVGERLKLTLSLWPYMIPLFTVYASEYALQSGVWTAIGFPVSDIDARNAFYTNSNWAYQVGVFISRSSGACCIAPMWALWTMPVLQCLNLIFFYNVATSHFWYSNSLLIPCFYVGLLGGSVYVNGYMRINKDLPFAIREFALSTVSVADSLGIVFADISGLFIQSCLYKRNGISGSVVDCPI